jgi:serine/threonine-protein kinase
MHPGLLVANRFRVCSPLGRGGMGSVWLAHHVELDMPCALKFVEGAGALDPDTRHRFAREAKAAALLRSPHVVQILDAGTWDGTPYLAMELLEGETLAERLARLGRLRPPACVAVVDQVARALTKAHAAGIIHRDLKPDNVFLARDDGAEVVKVLDFGIAKWAPGAAGGPPLTGFGALLGTPLYMSPEQARDSRSVDHRSDLWSLAVIAFECLTGRLPFDGQRILDVFMQILNAPLPVPTQVAPGLPRAFDAWWAKAADRDRARRFADAREQADALAVALGVSLGGRASDAPSSAAMPSASVYRPSAAPPTPRPAPSGPPAAAPNSRARAAPSAPPAAAPTSRPRAAPSGPPAAPPGGPRDGALGGAPPAATPPRTPRPVPAPPGAPLVATLLTSRPPDAVDAPARRTGSGRRRARNALLISVGLGTCGGFASATVATMHAARTPPATVATVATDRAPLSAEPTPAPRELRGAAEVAPSSRE